jgi:hypothetical protein
MLKKVMKSIGMLECYIDVMLKTRKNVVDAKVAHYSEIFRVKFKSVLALNILQWILILKYTFIIF